MAEIMTDKGVAIGNFIMLIMTLIVAVIFPFISDELTGDQFGYIWLTTGGITFLGTIYMCIFMKETKGLTQKEIDGLFRKIIDRRYSLAQ